MKTEVEISFEQMLRLVGQLNEDQKVQLAEELKKSAVGARLDEVLNIFRDTPAKRKS